MILELILENRSEVVGEELMKEGVGELVFVVVVRVVLLGFVGGVGRIDFRIIFWKGRRLGYLLFIFVFGW